MLFKMKNKSIQQSNYFISSQTRGFIVNNIDKDLKKIITTKPDNLFQFSVYQFKNSKRAKVSLIKVNGKKYIIKRYNIKNLLHKFRRICSTSPALNVWKNNKLFEAQKIRTSKIIAAIDLGKGTSYKGSFALYDYIEGADQSIETMLNYYLSEATRQSFISRITEVICKMHKKGIFHGDAKITNFIWVEKNGNVNINVIDLDGAILKRKVNNRQRMYDLKNLASSLALWNQELNPYKTILDSYISFHRSWEKKRDSLLTEIKKKSEKQLKHKIKRQGPFIITPQIARQGDKVSSKRP